MFIEPKDRHPEFVVAMSSHPGRRRKGNEDACAAAPQHGVFLVCDGMGGAASGEIASRLACDAFLHSIAVEPAKATPRARLRAACTAANRTVHAQAEADSALRGMGTTLVAVLLHPTKACLSLAHVGDSRCYLLRENLLRQLTADHSIVEQQIQAGQITREEAQTSPMRHLITRAIGARAKVEAEIQSLPIRSGDLFLLATDGLNRELADPEVEAILRHLHPIRTRERLDSTCTELIEAANARGGRDNITVLLLAIA